jgi:hypothetical protein
MSQERDEIIAEVREAFRGVKLGDGVGLHQGQAIDDWEDQATQLSERQKDEKENWEVIPTETLNLCHSSLCFFDAEGMRFHLPAFIIGDLRDELGCDAVFHLTELTDYALSKLTALTVAQHNAIRHYLLLVMNEPNYEFDRPAIESALSTYWQQK